MNLLWTIFNRGRTADTALPYARRTDGNLSDIPFNVRKTVTSLVPDSPEEGRYFRIERLVQAVLNGPYAQNVLEVDPLNTYDYSVTVTPALRVDNPTDLTVTTMPTGNKTIPVVTYEITLNTVSGTIGVSSEYGSSTHSLNMSGNLSDIIVLSESLSLRLQGILASQVNGSLITVEDSRHPAFDLPAAMASVEVPEWYDSEMRDVYIHGTTTEKLAAVMINAAKGVISG